MVLNHWSRRCDLVGRISGTSFFIVILVIIKSSPETIKQIRYLLNYEVSNRISINNCFESILIKKEDAANSNDIICKLQKKDETALFLLSE